ncbi:MAG: hypothetical protein WAU45_16305 [Blastocatellia bacterium]
MAHVTFIHGISNKPPEENLRRIWLRALARENGIDLETDGVTSSMVYWADVLYEKPLDEEALESAGGLENVEAVAAQDTMDIDMSWRERITGEERAMVDALALKLSFDVLVDDDYAPPESEMDKKLERIPLPWWIKRRLMKAHLRDVHHYLFDVKFSPRVGTTYKVREEIRRRALAKLEEGATKEGPHIIVSHSMGTVIAYDCLMRVEGCPTIDGLMTVGSPLGVDEVQDKLKPEGGEQPGWSREDGFPSNRLKGDWINIYDSLDPVTGFDGNIANDYKKGGQEVVEVINEQNWGKWRHSITKYLVGPKLRDGLKRLMVES